MSRRKQSHDVGLQKLRRIRGLRPKRRTRFHLSPANRGPADLHAIAYELGLTTSGTASRRAGTTNRRPRRTP